MNTNSLVWNEHGLLPVIVQHHRTLQVLMLGYMNKAALAATTASGKVTFYSRSRQQLWVKGETSGNMLHVKTISADCDNDTLLILADPVGPTCHTGSESCFAQGAPKATLSALEEVIASRFANPPAGSYTAKLASAGIARIAQKVGEEGVETALAAVTGEHLASEAADLLYHLLVLLQAAGSNLAAVERVLEERQGTKTS